MCSAGDGRLVWVSVARVVEQGHRGLGEVAADDGPFVVLVGEHGSDEADRGPVVGEDPDDVRAALHFLVEPLEGVVRPDLAPVLELPRSRGHLILGETLEEGGPCGSSSEVPARVPS